MSSRVGRVFYLIPHNTKPCGGIKVMYEHCQLLNKAGITAHPLHEGSFTLDWFEHEEVPLTCSDLPVRLDPNDVVVGNEVFPYAPMKLIGGRRVMFVQGTEQVLSAWQRGPRNPRLLQKIWNKVRPEPQRPSYGKIGYERVITCSSYLTNYLLADYGIEATTITNGIDHSFFTCPPEKKEANTILCLLRKNVEDGVRIKSLVKHPDAKFVELDNVPFKTLREHYQRADLFLATSYPEGFSLPPLEAMACGCVVVGFTGGAAKMFMKDRQTALVAPDGDCEEAARKLDELLGNPVLKEEIRAGGLREATEYTVERMEEELLAFYRGL
jgi:glycosyltransferase involved in cell wall biosynthesis